MYEELNKLIDGLERASAFLYPGEINPMYEAVSDYCQRRFDKLTGDEQVSIERRLSDADDLIKARNV